MTTRTSGLARDLERIGGPLALSTPVIFVSTGVMLGITVLLDLLAGYGSPSSWLIAGIGSVLVLIAFLFLARATLLPTQDRPSRPVIALLVFAAAGAVRYLSMNFFTQRLGLPQSANRSVLIAAAMMVAIMSLVTLIACRSQEHRVTLQQLTEERRRLLILGATFEERVAESERDLQEQIHAQLDPALAEIEALLGEDGPPDGHGETRDAVNVLSNAVSQIVRPMSQSLGSAPSAASATIEEAIYVPDESHPVRRADIKHALHPLATGLLCTLLTLSYLPGDISRVRSALIGLGVMLAVICLIGYAVRFLWPARLLVPLLFPALTVLFLLNGLVGVLVAQSASWITRGSLAQSTFASDLAPGNRGAIWAGLSATTIGFALSALTLAQRRLEAVEQDLRDVNTRLAIAVAQLRGQLWVNRRNLSWILHGPVQSALVSAALEMNNPDLGSEDRGRIRQRIRQAIDTIDSTSRREARLEHALGEIASVWEFSCDVHEELDPEAVTRLEGDPTATLAVIEVVREGVGNAVRHGGATHVDVSVTVPSPAFVHVRIRDNGSGLDPAAGTGMGTSLLDEVTYRWQRTNSDPGTLIEADVPLQA